MRQPFPSSGAERFSCTLFISEGVTCEPVLRGGHVSLSAKFETSESRYLPSTCKKLSK